MHSSIRIAAAVATALVGFLQALPDASAAAGSASPPPASAGAAPVTPAEARPPLAPASAGAPLLLTESTSSPRAQSRPSLAPGDHDLSLPHQGRTRTYIVHVPPQAASGAALPIVINLHGGGGNASAQKEYTHMDAAADREGYLAVYPNGTGRWGDRLLTWNAGTCCGYAADNKVDDVGFVVALLDDLARRTPVDSTRVYATGLSNGGMMAYRLAAEAADRIAAIAPVAGGMVLEKLSASRPVPILHFHSVDDPRALFHGGLGPPFPMTQRRVMQPDMEKVLARWVKFDGCPETPAIAPTIHGSGAEEGVSATKIVYGPCRAGTEVAFWKLAGSGHVWPGGTSDYLKHWLARSTSIVNANDEMWAFFKRWTLPALPRNTNP